MSRYVRPVKPRDAIEVEVAPGRLIYDQIRKQQVGRGERVLVHPAMVETWIRNGWVRLPEVDDNTEQAVVPESVKRSRRVSRTP